MVFIPFVQLRCTFVLDLLDAYYAGTRRPPNITATRYLDEAGLGAFMATGLYGGHMLVQKIPGWLKSRTQKANHHVYVYERRTKRKTAKRKRRS